MWDGREIRVCGEDFGGIGEEEGFGEKNMITDRNPDLSFTI